MTSDGLQEALAALPHRAPFRFVSGVRLLEPGVHGEGEWVVSGSEDFFAGHFPGDPIIPGVLLGEALAQLAGVVLAAKGAGPGGPVRLARVDVKFPTAVRPPADVQLEARLKNAFDHLALFDVVARVHSDVAATGQVVLAIKPAGLA